LGPTQEPFEFRAILTTLDQGLDLLHHSVELLRQALGRAPDDRPLLLFETALGEIGANVLTHGHPEGAAMPIEYNLHLEQERAVASFVDPGPAVREHLARAMPEPTSEDGRGLALARALLDEFAYQRDGGLNRWRLVKRL
jgi:serine/threonine-protein kinase RsbW